MFCSCSILNDEGNSLRPEPLGKTLTPLPQFSAEFLNVWPRERLTLYLTSSKAKLEGQQRRSLGDMCGEREVLLDGGRASRAETLEHEEGEQLLCARMSCSSVTRSGTMWLSRQEKLGQISWTAHCSLESGSQLGAWLVCIASRTVGHTEQWGPGKTPVTQSKQHRKMWLLAKRQ